MTHFSDLINIEEFWDKRNDFSDDRGDISFYCKDCKELVEVERVHPGWYTFICKLCSGKNIALWTSEWLKEMYKIKK